MAEQSQEYVFVEDVYGNYIVQDNKILIYNTKEDTQMWIPTAEVDKENDPQHDQLEEEEVELEEHEVSHEPSHIQEESAGSVPLQSKSSTNYQWENLETQLFITLIEKYFRKLQDSKFKKRDIFDEISKEMKATSKGKYNPSLAQCENRYKSLVKKFKDISDHNNRSGNNKKEWQFYSQLEKLFGNRANVTPKASCSSIMLQEQKKDQTQNSLAIEKLKKKLNASVKRVSTDDPSNPPKKKVTKVRSELLNILKTQEAKQNEQHAERMKLLQEQHCEIKDMFNKIIEKLNNN